MSEVPLYTLTLDCQTCSTRGRLCPPPTHPSNPAIFLNPKSLVSYTLHHTPQTLHHRPYTLQPTPITLHPTPYTLHPTPYTLHPTP